MQTTQLELSLWDNLEQASATAETADLDHLWQELEAAIGLLPHEQRLQTAGKAITQIVEVFALRCDLILSAWEEAHNEQDSAVDEDAIAGLVRQTMSLDLSELMEVPVAEQRQRQPLAPYADSVVGPVDKAALLEAFDSEIKAVEAEAQQQPGALSAAHEEDVSGWAATITKWLKLRQNFELVSLMQLQQGVGMSLIEVWLGLLLGVKEVSLEQRGNFYSTETLWIEVAEHDSSVFYV